MKRSSKHVWFIKFQHCRGNLFGGEKLRLDKRKTDKESFNHKRAKHNCNKQIARTPLENTREITNKTTWAKHDFNVLFYRNDTKS